MSLIKACIFDLDGVLVDTAKYHFAAWRRLANELGFDFTHTDNEKLKGVSRVESLRLILQWGGVEKSAAEQAELAALKNSWYTESIKEMPQEEILEGISPFLEHLRSTGIRIALGSASKNAGIILQQVGLTDYFEVIVDGNSVEKSKPDPEVFLKGAKALGLTPAECMVFEDAEKGIEAALNGGFTAIGLGDPASLNRAHLVLKSLSDWTLPQLIGALN